MQGPHLKRGLKIQIEIPPDGPKRRYLSQIEALDPDSISIQFPLPMDEKEAAIQVGMKCRIAFSIREGTYAFDAQIAEIRSAPAVVVIPRPETFYDWKRQHLRLDTGVWVRYAVVPREEMQGRIDQPIRSYTRTCNISGGGFLAQLSESPSIGAILEIEIEIPTAPDPVLAMGRITHVNKGEYGIEFLLIDDTDRDRLVRYIFDKERLSRRTVKMSR